MNQILSVEGPKKVKKNKVRNSAPIEIEKIVKILAIGMMLFGIFIIGSGSYAMYQNSKKAGNTANPTIYIEDTSATEITIQVTHDKELSKVTYNWNNEEPIEIDCQGKKKVEQKIDIPSGKNTLYIYAKDVNGLEAGTQRQYTIQKDIDIQIQLSEDKKSVIVKTEGKEQLSYMTYRWNNENEETVYIDDSEFELKINEIPSGENLLTVVVVDINNKSQTEEQKVKGVAKPKLNVTQDNTGNIVIKTSDEEGIKKIEFTINELDTYIINLDKVFPLEQRKEFEYTYPLNNGETNLEVRAYNENDIEEVFKAVFKK